MSFRDSQLQRGETILIDARPHAATLAAPLGTLIAALIVGFTLADTQENWGYLAIAAPFALWFLARWAVRQNTEYVITNYRVVRQTGVLSKTSIDAPLDKVNNIVHRQTFLQKLIHNGTVGLETASELGMLEFDNVPHPVEFKNAIMRARGFSSRGEGAVASGPLDALERLARLKGEGHLTEEEFQAEKKKLLL